MKPSRVEVEAAIKTATVWCGDHPDTYGVMIEVGKLRALTKAARWALELVDDDNPPLLKEELKGFKRRVPK